MKYNVGSSLWDYEINLDIYPGTSVPDNKWNMPNGILEISSKIARLISLDRDEQFITQQGTAM